MIGAYRASNTVRHYSARKRPTRQRNGVRRSRAAYLPAALRRSRSMSKYIHGCESNVLFVTQNPWMNDDVLDAIGVELPRGVRGHQRGHAAEKLHPLRTTGQPLGLVVKRVELREVEPPLCGPY